MALHSFVISCFNETTSERQVHTSNGSSFYWQQQNRLWQKPEEYPTVTYCSLSLKRKNLPVFLANLLSSKTQPTAFTVFFHPKTHSKQRMLPVFPFLAKPLTMLFLQGKQIKSGLSSLPSLSYKPHQPGWHRLGAHLGSPVVPLPWLTLTGGAREEENNQDTAKIR